MITTISLEAKQPTSTLLKELISTAGGVRVTLYLNLEHKADSFNHARITLKNEIKKATEALSRRGMSHEVVEHLLEPAHALLAEPERLQDYDSGIGLFLSEAEATLINAPCAVQSSLTISNRYYLKPLIKALGAGQGLLVLLLNQHKTELMRYQSGNITPVEAPDMPSSVQEIAKYDEPQEGLQQHTSTQSSAQGRAGSEPVLRQHGHGGGKDLRADQEAKFFSQVQHALMKYLNNSQTDLLVIGDSSNVGHVNVERSHPDRRVFYYKINPEAFTNEALLAYCHGIVQERMDDRVKDVIRQIDQQPMAMVETTIAGATTAAMRGEIDCCVMAEQDDVVGVVHGDSMEVDIRPNDRGNDCAHDLLDVIAQETLRHGGTAYIAKRGELPQNLLVLAKRRF